MKRVVFVGVVLASLIAICLGLYYAVRIKTNPNEIVLYGNVDVRQVDIGFRVSGRVAALYFEEGDLVPKDALMAILDQSPYDAQIEEARANLASVKASLENANIQLGRRELAVNFGGVSREDFDNAFNAQ